MSKEEVIKICDLYKEGYGKLCEIMNNAYSYCKERDEMLDAELVKKGGGHEYVHNWAIKYVLDNLTEDIIEKACKWLDDNLYTTYDMFNNTGIDGVNYHTVEELIEGFKKAMNND